MWNTWIEKGKALADQGKALAENLEDKINESVGVETTTGTKEAPIANVDLNDTWNDDFDDDDGILQQSNGNVAVEAPSIAQVPPPKPVVASLPPDPVVAQPEPVIASLPPEKPVIASIPPEPVVASLPPEPVVEPLVASIPEPQQQSVQEDGWANNEEDEMYMDEVEIDGAKETPASQQKEPIDGKERGISPPHVTTNEMHFMPQQEDEQAVVTERIQAEVANDMVPPSLVEEPIPVVSSDKSPPPEEVARPEVVKESTPAPSAGWEDEMYADHDEEVVPPPSEPVPRETSHVLSPQEPVAKGAPPRPMNQDNELHKERQLATEDHSKEAEERILQLQEEHQLAMTLLQSQMEEMQVQLKQREEQLASKAEQSATMEAMHESEKEALLKKISETKEEAKKRIMRAKERVEAMEKRLKDASKSADEAGEQGALIAALREEGEKLARKQSEMEKAVRAAHGETRELKELMEGEVAQKEKALAKIATLEADLKQTKEELASARTGESRSSKLEMELSKAREETELKAAANLSLEQQVKELKVETKELRQELEDARRTAEQESHRASKMLKKEHSELLTDLESKLRTSEREANVREDALRHEVAELRKRWQDAVRRADALSMDVQSSTAPLIRQLESTERQNRARAAAWAELETKLRSDLEEHVIQNEKLMKERNDLRTNWTRLDRVAKEREEELTSTKNAMEEQNAKVGRLEAKLLEMETEGQRTKEEWAEVERLANEGVSRVRSEMMKTVVESEERYRSQIEALEKELKEEREKRAGFERQLQELAESAGMMTFASPKVGNPALSESKEKKLKAATGQAEILASTLSGLDSDDEDDASAPLDDVEPASISGFAAMEQLTQRLKASTVELEALRKQLVESEKTRESLATELGETRHASEKLPLFEQKVKELTEDNKEKELEIMALRDDIAEVRQLYRTQLDVLLEEKAATLPANATSNMNGGSTEKSFETAPESETEKAPIPSEQQNVEI